MANIDVALDPELQEYLNQPVCVPMPEPGSAKVDLPMGGTLKGLSDITKSIPDMTDSFSQFADGLKKAAEAA